ncbi:DJ-1/PfpI/YhbO family deglycase/protease [Pigmentiphaga sp.]|uniref:DJ-1/PfpI/YhbO family deglycase/protease n=1 Tax=Pigmentiphaga sp. TaxID=1977564 RepID=UPI00128E0423|nr:DJ-1/PfpI/YhbO family deglycase/protease [Pigmentiphaga sp.]MPS28299.1 DJ-1/PfpI/YhbO family deglycase/protease [Alcaligenaceae bacterium SAGV5]MPS51333.1 DJ-1/PfpI/YhbO family deglycase/protease [Alcaligenaceae bacterium SAGV3]MPT55901.1 DJ-1/PfpI/YhbO family deglycase/protease [Alcaligenaceae bacterium]
MSKPVAVLLYPGFQELEFWYPVLRLREARREVVVLGTAGQDAAYSRLGYPVVPNRAVAGASGADFAAVVIPGGNTGALGHDPVLRAFLDEAAQAGALLAAVSEGRSLLGKAVDGAITAASTDDLPAWGHRLMSALDATSSLALPREARIAILAENQYQELELWHPLLRLREAGAHVLVVGPARDQVYASKLGYPVRPDLAVADVTAGDFDAVVIPGGFAPEGMRRHKAMIDFVRDMDARGNLVAAICHAGWVLASAGIAKDRDVTCVALIRDDVIHAGGRYRDEAVVRDRNLITSRLPSDLHLFCGAILDYLRDAPAASPAGRRLAPADGRAPASAVHAQRAVLGMGPRGIASADYTTVVNLGETVVR